MFVCLFCSATQGAKPCFSQHRRRDFPSADGANPLLRGSFALPCHGGLRCCLDLLAGGWNPMEQACAWHVFPRMGNHDPGPSAAGRNRCRFPWAAGGVCHISYCPCGWQCIGEAALDAFLPAHLKPAQWCCPAYTPQRHLPTSRRARCHLWPRGRQ